MGKLESGSTRPIMARSYVPVRSSEEAGFLVLIRYGTEIASYDFKVCIVPYVVSRHFEHSKVEVRYGAKGATRDQNDWLFCGVTHDSGKAVKRESIVRGIIERSSWFGGHG